MPYTWFSLLVASGPAAMQNADTDSLSWMVFMEEPYNSNHTITSIHPHGVQVIIVTHGPYIRGVNSTRYGYFSLSSR